MLCAEGTIFCHIPAGLTHEPDRRAINRLTPAGFQEAIIYHFDILETRGRMCQFTLGGCRGCAIVGWSLCQS